MATEALMIRRGSGLAPADRASAAALDGLPQGATLRAVLTQPRNPGHHRKFWALLTIVQQAADERYPTPEHLLDALKIATGHCDSYRLAGREVIRPRSISFGAMDQQAFEAFYDRCVALILQHILPGVDRADLEREVLEMIEPQTQARAA